MQSAFNIPTEQRDLAQCPIRLVLSRLCDKWSILIILAIHDNAVVRFNDLASQIPDISSRVLSGKLKTLYQMKLITRTVYPEVPPRVEYALTTEGKSFIPVLNQMIEWASKHKQQLQH